MEAAELIARAIDRLQALEEAERKPSSAVPRGVMTCGELDSLLATAIMLMAYLFPSIADPLVIDLAAIHNRVRH